MAEVKAHEAFVDSWNGVIQSLIATRDLWEKHRLFMQKNRNIDQLTTYEAQKCAGLMFNKMTFEKALLDFVPFLTGRGGMEVFLLPSSKVRKKTKEKMNYG